MLSLRPLASNKVVFNRDRRCNSLDSNRKRVQRLKSGVIHRHILPAIGVLFYASLRCVLRASMTRLKVHLSLPLGRLADILGRKGAMLLALTLFGEC